MLITQLLVLSIEGSRQALLAPANAICFLLIRLAGKRAH